MDEIQMEKYFIMSLAHLLLFPTLHEKKPIIRNQEQKIKTMTKEKNLVNLAESTWEPLIKNASEPLNYRLNAHCLAVRNFSEVNVDNLD